MNRQRKHEMFFSWPEIYNPKPHRVSCWTWSLLIWPACPREALVSVLGLQVCAVMSSILFSCGCWGLRLGPYVCKVNTVPIKPLLQPRYYFFNKCAWLKISLQIIKHSIDSQGQALETEGHRRTEKKTESLRPGLLCKDPSQNNSESSKQTTKRTKTTISEIRKIKREKPTVERRKKPQQNYEVWRIKHKWKKKTDAVTQLNWDTGEKIFLNGFSQKSARTTQEQAMGYCWDN